MNDVPKITIITPSFNQGQYLTRSISSVISQGYPNLEYFVIDGGSSDASVDVIRQHEDHIDYWVSEEDSGQSAAINKGLMRATGELIGWIASDDWYEPGCFERVVSYYKQHPNAIVLGDCMRHYEPAGRQRLLRPTNTSFSTLLRYWKSGFCPPQPSIFFPSAVLKKVGLLNENLNYAMDLDLWLRMSRITEFVYIPNVLSHYLIHSESKSGSGDGFLKFRKEWKSVCFAHLRDAPIVEKVKFFLEYYYYRIRFPARVSVE